MAPLRLQGRSAAPGFASGPLFVLPRRQAAARPAGSPQAEAEALRQAILGAIGDIEDLIVRLQGDASEMMVFQRALLEDPVLSEGAFAAISAGQAADSAWSAALDSEIAGYRSSDDDYFRARASDLADLRDRVLTGLGGGRVADIPPGSILLAADLTPSQFLTTDWREGGIALWGGSPASHVAMLARSHGVPMLVGLEMGSEQAAALVNGAVALLEGGTACLTLAPDDTAHAAFAEARARGQSLAASAEPLLHQPARMADGTPVTVLLNVADPSDLDGLDPSVCDGIGLVRTELLFDGAAPPDEDAQLAIYRRIVRWAAGRPVTIRTLDAGGDKRVAGITLDDERNPFLGVRGIRLSLRFPDLFKVQLRALARVASEGPVEVMIPMVSVPAELEAVRALFAEVCRELAAEGLPHRMPPLGIMVEVPAAAILPGRFEAAFYSIGSNDLVQYTLAAGRDVAALADLADLADPSVLHLIAAVAAHGAANGRKVSLCGDAGGDPRYIPQVLEAGVRILSMSAADIGRAKLAIAAYTPRAGS